MRLDDASKVSKPDDVSCDSEYGGFRKLAATGNLDDCDLPEVREALALTLDQVKQAGRFAFHQDGHFVTVPHFGVCLRYWQPGETYLYEDDLSNGWHHLPGCDCEFCHE